MVWQSWWKEHKPLLLYLQSRNMGINAATLWSHFFLYSQPTHRFGQVPYFYPESQLVRAGRMHLAWSPRFPHYKHSAEHSPLSASFPFTVLSTTIPKVTDGRFGESRTRYPHMVQIADHLNITAVGIPRTTRGWWHSTCSGRAAQWRMEWLKTGQIIYQTSNAPGWSWSSMLLKANFFLLWAVCSPQGNKWRRKKRESLI